MAVWSLTPPQWEHPQVLEVLERLRGHEDPDTAKAAVGALETLRKQHS